MEEEVVGNSEGMIELEEQAGDAPLLLEVELEDDKNDGNLVAATDLEKGDHELEPIENQLTCMIILGCFQVCVLLTFIIDSAIN